MAKVIVHLKLPDLDGQGWVFVIRSWKSDPVGYVACGFDDESVATHFEPEALKLLQLQLRKEVPGIIITTKEVI